jgi:hypothetical protein
MGMTDNKKPAEAGACLILMVNPHISPVSRNLAPDRCHWAPDWTEGHSRSYGLREDQAQWYMNKPEPG